ncbi:hypothetical protein OSB04_022184 [Centaurea solstitialis]|uniref:Uncharacterized protein n=1 Tax=Centaurea solstitialis TaxID=347529 RepID=A0AA38T6X0_9ASTR|nr:hypothetical protein OSB04_022184 [Centaurea solstitialis]
MFEKVRRGSHHGTLWLRLMSYTILRLRHVMRFASICHALKNVMSLPWLPRLESGMSGTEHAVWCGIEAWKGHADVDVGTATKNHPRATNGTMDVGDLLKPMLGSGDLRCNNLNRIQKS